LLSTAYISCPKNHSSTVPDKRRLNCDLG
jgi:hypothetical protein